MLKRVLMILLGSCIGVAIVAWRTGELALEVLLGFFTGGLIILLVNFILKKLKKDDTPQVDERIVSNVRNFLVYCLYGSVFVLLIGIVILELLDYKAIPLTYIYIYLAFVISVIGIGGQIVKRS